MNQSAMAKRLAELHIKGKPLILFNIWDAGGARAITKAGASAVATSSYAVAQAHGYQDGESVPRDFVERIAGRIVSAVDVPVSIDFESGYVKHPATAHYAGDDDTLAENTARLLDLGVAGINFEDRIPEQTGVYDIDRQVRRIAILRRVADQKGVPLFINARTDVFLQGTAPERAVDDAVARARAYADAGASGFFIPGLQADGLIAKICEHVRVPVNVMVMDGVSPNARLSELGVARISYGPIPHIRAMQALEQSARSALAA